MTENKALVQSLYAAFGRGDVPFILAHLAEAADWISTGDATIIPWCGVRRGQDGALSFFQALGSHLDFELFEPLQFVAEGDIVVVRGHTVATVKMTGRSFDSEWIHIFTITDGQVTRFQEFYDTAAIIAALRPH